MTDLRKAAEQAIEAIMHGGVKEQAAAVYKLRQALNVDAVNISAERVDETAKRKHECPDWDFLEIDEDDPEFESCLCYTATPKREWVGLTDKEMSELANKYKHIETGWRHDMDLIAEAEAKLKEKNSG